VADYFERYGFASNPFSLRELDPFQIQEDEHHLLRDIDGFVKLDDVGSYLGERTGAAVPAPAFVVITGNKKSGLSSAANAVLSQYREIRKLGNRFAVAKVKAADHSVTELYNRWVAALDAELQLLQLELSEKVAEKLQSARTLHNDSTLDYDLRGVVAGLLPALQVGKAGIGSCLEEIKSAKAIEIAEVVFSRVPTLCVFTAEAGVLDAEKLADTSPHICVIRLSHLSREDVGKVLLKRWGEATPLPFDLPTLGRFCESQKHPIGVVLTVVERLLKRRVRVYEELNGQGRWPTEEKLGFTDVTTLELLQGELEALIRGSQ